MYFVIWCFFSFHTNPSSAYFFLILWMLLTQLPPLVLCKVCHLWKPEVPTIFFSMSEWFLFYSSYCDLVPNGWNRLLAQISSTSLRYIFLFPLSPKFLTLTAKLLLQCSQWHLHCNKQAEQRKKICMIWKTSVDYWWIM